MTRLNKLLAAGAGALLAASLSYATADEANETTETPVAVDAANQTTYAPMGMGDENAPAVIVEYASVTCSHCADFHHDVLEELKPRIEAGELRYELREFLTSPAAVAMAGYQIARCAGEDEYFNVVDTLFDRQTEVLLAARQGKAKSKLEEIATEFGFDNASFNACLLDEDLFETIEGSIDEGIALGVKYTPTIFLNGEKLQPTDTSLSRLNTLIDELNGIEEDDTDDSESPE
jgi:protein-disulfide isomerase